jgi:ABC-type amino acid transport system permease subunit
LGGSYMAEAFRAGLEGVAFSQQEAAAALGFTRWQSLRLIIIPQALATSIPALGANVIFLLKETSVFSVVALADLVYVAKDIIGLYYKTDEALLLLGSGVFINPAAHFPGRGLAGKEAALWRVWGLGSCGKDRTSPGS